MTHSLIAFLSFPSISAWSYSVWSMDKKRHRSTFNFSSQVPFVTRRTTNPSRLRVVSPTIKPSTCNNGDTCFSKMPLWSPARCWSHTRVTCHSIVEIDRRHRSRESQVKSGRLTHVNVQRRDGTAIIESANEMVQDERNICRVSFVWRRSEMSRNEIKGDTQDHYRCCPPSSTPSSSTNWKLYGSIVQWKIINLQSSIVSLSFRMMSIKFKLAAGQSSLVRLDGLPLGNGWQCHHSWRQTANIQKNFQESSPSSLCLSLSSIRL